MGFHGLPMTVLVTVFVLGFLLFGPRRDVR
jgi:hypothetical protein